MNVFCRRKQQLLFILLCSIELVNAQQKNNYSLSVMVDSAMKHYPQLLQKKALVNSAIANVKDVRHSYLPSFNISDEINVASANQLPGTSLPMEIIPSISGGTRSSNNWQAASTNIAVFYSEYLLADFGLKNARINNAISFSNVQQSDLQRTGFSVKAGVTQTYLQLVQAELRLNAEKKNIDRYQYIFKLIKSITRSGINPGVDSSQAKAELSKARSQFNQVKGIVNQLKDQLSYYTGIAPDKIVADSSSQIYLTDIMPAEFNMDSINHPFIDYYIRKRDFDLATEKLVSKSFLPKVILAGSTWARGSSISYNDQYKSLANGLGYERFNYAAGVSVVYDLFNTVHKRDKLAVSRFETEAAGYELEQQRLSLNIALTKSDDAIKTADDNLIELPIQMNAAQDVYQQKLAQYKAGIISLIDLTNASFVLYRSEIDYIDAKNSWYTAVFDKATATNNLDIFIQQIK